MRLGLVVGSEKLGMEVSFLFFLLPTRAIGTKNAKTRDLAKPKENRKDRESVFEFEVTEHDVYAYDITDSDELMSKQLLLLGATRYFKIPECEGSSIRGRGFHTL